MHGRDTTNDSRSPEQIPHSLANVIDLTSRLPKCPPQPEEAPSPKRPSRLTDPKVWLGLIMFLSITSLGLWIGRHWMAMEMMGSLRSRLELVQEPERMAVTWPAEGNRPLRLLGLSDAELERILEDASPAYQLLPGADTWFSDVTDRAEPSLLRIQALVHLKQAVRPELILLATKELEASVASEGFHPRVANDLAVAQALLAEKQTAMELLDRALQFAPRDPVLFFNAAQVSRALGPTMFQKELLYLSKYLEIDQGSQWRRGMEIRFDDMTEFSTRLDSDFGRFH